MRVRLLQPLAVIAVIAICANAATFDYRPELLVKMHTYLNMRILSVGVEWPSYLVTFSQKTAGEVESANRQFLASEAEWRGRNPLEE